MYVDLFAWRSIWICQQTNKPKRAWHLIGIEMELKQTKNQNVSLVYIVIDNKNDNGKQKNSLNIFIENIRIRVDTSTKKLFRWV